MLKRLISLLMISAGVLIAPATATAAPASGSPVYTPPALLPWGAPASNHANLSQPFKAPAVSAAQATTNKAALKGMPSKSSASSMAAKAGPTYFYATADQTPAAGTTAVWAYNTISAPALSGATHSLEELAVIQTTAGTGARQIVEIGWTMDTGICGGAANSPCVFTYWWKNGVGQGYNAGAPAWATAAGAVTAPGASLVSAVGVSKRFGISYTAGSGSSPGCWWLAYDTAYMGCFPDTDWSGTTLGINGSNVPSVTFNSVPYYQTFGEIAYSGVQAAATACADMGNGILGTTTTAPLSNSWGSAFLTVSGASVNANMATGTAAYPTYWNSNITAAGRTHRNGGPGAC